MDTDPDFSTKDTSEAEDWWIYQITLLLGGFACGFLVHFLTQKPADSATKAYQMGSSFSTCASSSMNSKMVLIVRSDLSMGKGKVAAQCAHAAVACYRKSMTKTPGLLKNWERYGQAKVALKIENYAAMLELKKRADKQGLTTCIIHDAGRTQIEEGTATVLGIGPGPVDVLDTVSGHLKLL